MFYGVMAPIEEPDENAGEYALTATKVEDAANALEALKKE